MLTPLRGFEGNYRITITGSHHLKVAVCFCTYSAGPTDTRRSSRQIRRADCWLSLLIPDADNQIAAAPSCQYRLHAEDLKSCVRIPGFLEFTSRPFHDATGTFLVKHHLHEALDRIKGK